jgi:hypothetical protein
MVPPNAVIYRLKISLSGVRPSVWRRVLAPGNLELRDLHRVIQVTMGWKDVHLHQFVVGGTQRYGVPESERGSTLGDERRIRLAEVAPGKGGSFVYEYDFGSCWRHEVRVERIEAATDGARGPLCLGGERACPPEDCGGPSGYAHLLEILSDPKHPEHRACRGWIGPDFDSTAFDVDQVNDGLVRNGPRARRADLAWLRPGWI